MNEERRKASACLQPGRNIECWEHGHEQPLELQQQQQMWHEQNPSWSSSGGGSMGPVTKVRKHCPSAAHHRGVGGLAMDESWRCGIKLGAPHCTAAICELIWLAFLPWAVAENTTLSRGALTISRGADNHNSFFNFLKYSVSGCITHGL